MRWSRVYRHETTKARCPGCGMIMRIVRMLDKRVPMCVNDRCTYEGPREG